MNRDHVLVINLYLSVEFEDFQSDILAGLEKLTKDKKSSCSEVTFIYKAHLKHALEESSDTLHVWIGLDRSEHQSEVFIKLRELGQVHFEKYLIERSIEAIGEAATLGSIFLLLRLLNLERLQLCGCLGELEQKFEGL